MKIIALVFIIISIATGCGKVSHKAENTIVLKQEEIQVIQELDVLEEIEMLKDMELLEEYETIKNIEGL